MVGNNHPNRNKPKWRPIETAPNNENILLLHEGGISVGWWDARFEWLGDGEGDDYRGAWMDGTVASWAYEEYAELTPTMWLPLPAKPLTP